MRTFTNEEVDQLFAEADAKNPVKDKVGTRPVLDSYDLEEIASVLYQARSEIMHLRGAVQGMKAKAEAYDLMLAALLGRNMENFGVMTEDILPYVKLLADRLLEASEMKTTKGDLKKEE